MDINFKEYLADLLPKVRDEILEYKKMLSHIDKIEDVDEKCKMEKEVCDFIYKKESLLYAAEVILKEL